MIDPNKFSKILYKKVKLTVGVPDSLLKHVCNSFEKKFKKKHIVSTNEGSAVAIGIGYHLQTGKIPIIYLQNSGLGNMINPILSLADPKVFKIPLLIIMGWRGEKSKVLKDEPQHMTQGNLTEDFLKLLFLQLISLIIF